MLRAIIVGFLQITSDYFIKPLLAVLFNGLCQPPFIFIRNVLQSICKMLDPVAKLLTTFLRPIADLVRAFRVVEVKNINRLWQEPKGSQKLKVLQEQGSVWIYFIFMTVLSENDWRNKIGIVILRQFL